MVKIGVVFDQKDRFARKCQIEHFRNNINGNEISKKIKYAVEDVTEEL